MIVFNAILRSNPGFLALIIPVLSSSCEILSESRRFCYYLGDFVVISEILLLSRRFYCYLGDCDDISESLLLSRRFCCYLGVFMIFSQNEMYSRVFLRQLIIFGRNRVFLTMILGSISRCGFRPYFVRASATYGLLQKLGCGRSFTWTICQLAFSSAARAISSVIRSMSAPSERNFLTIVS